MKKTIITYTSRKNASKVYTFVNAINDGTTAVLVDSEGNNHLYAMNTLRKNFKKFVEEVEIEEPKAETKPMTKHQKVAAEQLDNAYNWIVGGYMNAVQDGYAEEMPPVEDMFNEVLDEATTHLYGEGMCSMNPAPAAMNFAGKRFILDTLADLFRAEGYEVPENLLKVPEKRKAAGPRKNIKGNPEVIGEEEVVMRAFTGMLIGVFKIVERDENTLSVELADGTHMDFDVNTGKEIGARNPRFANRIEL